MVLSGTHVILIVSYLALFQRFVFLILRNLGLCTKGITSNLELRIHAVSKLVEACSGIENGDFFATSVFFILYMFCF